MDEVVVDEVGDVQIIEEIWENLLKIVDYILL